MVGSEKGSEKESSQESSQNSSQKIIKLMQGDSTITIAALTDRAVKKQIKKLKAEDRIRRIGPDRGGHWEVVH